MESNNNDPVDLALDLSLSLNPCLGEPKTIAKDKDSSARRLVIRDTNLDASLWAAQYITDRIDAFKPTAQKPHFILGLPTGSSPELIYKNLVRAHRDGKLSFKNVVTFNMDEYVGLRRDHPQSYHTFMYTHLFAHIDIQPRNVHILDGCAVDLLAECASYEASIASHGGIDLFLGGVGADGHIAFNEPGSSLSSLTRIKSLVPETITANARFFGGDESKVPRMALTVGVGTIMASREVLIIATGASKAAAVRAGVEGPVSHWYTISKLQEHRTAVLVVDEAACGELKLSTFKYFKGIEQTAANAGIGGHAKATGHGPKL